MKTNLLLQKITAIILNTIPTSRIVLLAYINKERRNYSVFENDSLQLTDPAELNLLVIARNFNGDRHAAVDTIEQRCSGIIPTTILFLTIEDFASMLSHRSPFITAIMQSNQVLYSENCQSVQEEKGQTKFPLIDSELMSWYKRAMSFWKIAGTQFRFGEYGMATFCIHQAAEQFLSLLIQTRTGYRVGSHNLSRFLRLLRFYIPEANNVFNIETSLEKKRFLLLKSAYICFRYRDNFKITGDDAFYFLKEVTKLQRIAEQVVMCNSNGVPA